MSLQHPPSENDQSPEPDSDTEEHDHAWGQLSDAFASHRIVLDENRKPIDYIFLEINNQFEEFTGLTEDQVIGKPVTEVFPGIRDSEPDLIAIYGRVALTGDPTNFELFFPPLDRWYSILVYSVKVEHFITVFKDITIRKKTEALSHEQEQLFRNIADNIPNSYLSIIERDYSIGFTSGQEFVKQGLDPKHFIGLTLEQVFGEHSDMVREYYERTFNGDEQSFEIFINDQYQLYRTVPLIGGDGSIPRILTVVENITEDKKTQAKLDRTLLESEHRRTEVEGLLIASKAVLEYRSFEDAARVIFDTCKDIIGASSGYVALLSDDGAENEVLFLEAGGLPCTVDPELPMPIRGLRGEVYRTGRAAYDNSFEESEWWAFMPKGHVRLENVMFAPLISKGKSIGLIGIANKPGGFTDDDARIASAFGEIATISLLNSRTLTSLHESEERFRGLFEQSNDPIFLHTLTGEIRDVNNRAISLLGYSREELLKLTIPDLHPLGQKDSARIGMEQMKTQDSFRMESTFMKADGTIIDIDISSSIIDRDQGLVQGIVRDITERKHAEEQIRIQKEFTDTALDAQTDTYFLFEVTTGKAIRWNRAFREVSGFSDEEIASLPAPSSYYRPEDLERAATAVQQAVEEGSAMIVMDLLTKDGRAIPTEYKASAMLDKNGDPKYLVSIGRDITDRKLVEDQITSHLNFINRIIDESPFCIWIADPTGTVIRTNRMLRDTLTLTDEQIVGTYNVMNDTNLQEQGVMPLVKQVFSELEPVHFTIPWSPILADQFEYRDERDLWIDVTMFPILDTEGKLMSVVCHWQDITEQKVIQREVLEWRDRYESAIQASGHILYDWDPVSNEVTYGGNIGSILGYSMEEMKGGLDTWRSFIHEEDISKFDGDIRHLIETGESANLSYRIRKKDGTYIHVEDSGNFLRNDDGEIIRMIGFVKDFTERKAAEDALDRQTKFLDRIIETSALSTWISDEKGTAIRTNPACLAFFGATEEEVIGKYNLFNDSVIEGQGVMPQIRRVFEEGEIASLIIDYDFGAVDHVDVKDATHKYVNSIFTPILDDSGKVTNVIIQTIDLTEIKQFEKALHEKEEKYRTLFENMINGFALHEVVLDEAGRPVDYIFLEANSAFENLTGLEHDSILGRPVTEVIPGIKDDPADWISTYGDIAINGGERRFEQFSEAIGKWFSILAFSPGKGRFATMFEDITERRIAQDSLMESQLFNETLLETSPDTIYIYDIMEKQNIYSNRGIEHILGYTVQEIRDFGEDMIRILMHPDDFSTYVSTVLPRYANARDGEIIEHEYRMRNNDGDWRWLHSKELIFLRGEDGNPTRIFGLLSDITERKQIEDALRKNEEMLSAFMDSATDSFYLLDSELNFLDVNRKGLEIIGKGKDEVLGKNISEIVPNIKESGRYDNHLEVMRTGKPFVVEDFVPHPVFGDMHFMLRSFKVGDGLGVIATDISEQKVYLEEIEKLAKFPSENPNPVLRMSSDGTILFANEASVPILDAWNCKEGECIPGEWKQIALNALKANKPHRTDVTSGETIFSVTFAPVPDSDFLNVYALDITSRKKLEEELLDYSEHLQELVDIRTKDLTDAQDQLVRKERLAILGQLAGGISHELRNPLGAINNAVYYLNMVLENPSDEVKESLDIIRKEVSTSNNIITSLLDFARPYTPIMKPIDTNEIISSVLDRIAPPPNITVEFDPVEDLPRSMGDPDKIKQALVNIVQNAYQAMSDGGNLRISVALGDPGQIEILISDTGVGMSEDVLAKIFEPLFTTKAKGIGLGLSLTKTLIEMNKGIINVTTKEGEGSTFIITLPAFSNGEDSHA
jgi:PAS domain S-box-containing protein